MDKALNDGMSRYYMRISMDCVDILRAKERWRDPVIQDHYDFLRKKLTEIQEVQKTDDDTKIRNYLTKEILSYRNLLDPTISFQ